MVFFSIKGTDMAQAKHAPIMASWVKGKRTRKRKQKLIRIPRVRKTDLKEERSYEKEKQKKEEKLRGSSNQTNGLSPNLGGRDNSQEQWPK